MVVDTKSTELKSPLKGETRGIPGHSVDTQLRHAVLNDFLPVAALVGFILFFTVLEWVRWALNAPPYPRTATVICLAGLCIGIVKFFRTQRAIHSYRLGRDGEREVAYFIDGLIADGCVVFHDIPFAGFNIDHAIVSRFGVFVVETKTISKRGDQYQVWYEQGVLTFPGVRHPEKMLHQAAREAEELHKLLLSMSARSIAVQPILTLPGRYIVCERPTDAAVWVLAPKAIRKMITSGKYILSEGQVAECAHHLQQHLKNSREAEANTP